VPNVVGLTLGEAIDRLAGVNLTVTGVMAGAPPPTPQHALRIYIQNPPAGSPLPADMSAMLTQYGSGEETAPAPPPSDPSPPAPPQPAPAPTGSSEYVGEFRGTWQRGPVYWNGEPSPAPPIPAEPLVVRIAQDQGIWRVTAERTDAHIGTQQIGGPGGTCTMDAGSLRCEETAGSNHYVLTLRVNGNELDGEFNAHGIENRTDADGNPLRIDIRVGAVLKASRSN
jgi:hypothetical protein